MRILFDECIDRRFARELSEFDTATVPQMGWAGIKNGELMKLAEVDFDVFVTVDRNLSYQQNLAKYNIALVVLKARSNRYVDLLPFAEPIRKSLSGIHKGRARLISIPEI